MKKIIITLLVISVSAVTYSQKIDKSQVPLSVKNNVYLKINDTINVTWEKVNEMYKAKFNKEELKAEIFMKQNGEWVCTIWDIPQIYIPQAIKTNLNTNYPDYKVIRTTIQYRTEGDYYVIEIKNKKTHKSLLYNLKGEFVKDESVIITPVPIPKP